MNATMPLALLFAGLAAAVLVGPNAIEAIGGHETAAGPELPALIDGSLAAGPAANAPAWDQLPLPLPPGAASPALGVAATPGLDAASGAGATGFGSQPQLRLNAAPGGLVAQPLVHRGDGTAAAMAALQFRVQPVPEPQAWVLMLAGFGLVGAGLRRRHLATL